MGSCGVPKSPAPGSRNTARKGETLQKEAGWSKKPAPNHSRGHFAGAQSPQEFDDQLGTTEVSRTFLHRQSWKPAPAPRAAGREVKIY